MEHKINLNLINDSNTVETIFELKEKYNDWLLISNKMEIPINILKDTFAHAISLFKNGNLKSTNIKEAISRDQENYLFEFAFDNFSNLCHFCLNLSDQLESLSDADDALYLLNKIKYTLQENVSQQFLICENCKNRVEEYYFFKKQIELNTDIFEKCLNRLKELELPKEEASNHDLHESICIENLEELPEDQILINENESKPIKKERKKSFKEGRGKKGMQCNICGKIVKALSMHLLIHSGEKKHSCKYCSKSFTQSGQLKRHINSHLNIRNYECPICPRKFVDPSSVKKHLVIHNPEKKFQCSICGSRFNRLGALRYHEKTHRQERNYHCDICKKSFLAKYDLTKHLRIHTGEKPYSCIYCDKKFSISKNAKVHLRVHTKEKPYDCKFCNLSFSYRSSLKNHIIKIHHANSNLSLTDVTRIENPESI